jgi:hypothetical protein
MKTLSCKVLVMGVLGLVAAMGLGCSGPHMSRHDVVVSMDESLKVAGTTPTVRVDIVGIPDTEREQWAGKTINDYWRAGDGLRKDAVARKEMSFAAGRTESQTLKKTDSQWDEWAKRKAMHLVIIADLSGGTDGRRLILPLDSTRWKPEDKTIKIVVQSSRLRCDTDPEPEEKK